MAVFLVQDFVITVPAFLFPLVRIAVTELAEMLLPGGYLRKHVMFVCRTAVFVHVQE
jgi:hypothetical protein